MKKVTIILTGVILMTIAALNVNAQINPTVSATASAGATIIIPISIAKDVDMAFGNVAPSATEAGTVTLATDGTRTNSVVSLPTVTGTVAAAKFTVTGQTTSLFSITLPEDDVIQLTGTGVSMNLTDFVHDAGIAPALVGGTKTFQVGATLNVGMNQAAGVYTAPFPVTVNYN